MGNKTDKKRYNFLIAPFEEWFLEKYDQFLYEGDTGNFLDDYKYVANKLNMSVEDFLKIYCEPYEKLTEDIISDIQLVQSGFLFHFSKSKVTFKYDYEYLNMKNALEWLLVNIVDLNLFKLNETAKYYKLPEAQCHYCGKLESDPKGKKFNGSHFLCHTIKCKSKTVNPKPHLKTKCCAGYWWDNKKSFIAEIDKILERKDFTAQELELKIPELKCEEKFLKFCEKQLEHNLDKIDVSIRYYDKVKDEIIESRIINPNLC